MSISIIEFSVENFKIFKERATFSMSARKNEHTFDSNGQNLLRTSLIYGPNASGKSSLLDAFGILRNGIINSANNPDPELLNSQSVILPYAPFKLSDAIKPSFCEVVFSLDDKIFRYNFSILEKEIISENLFEILSSEKEKEYLRREKQTFNLYNDFDEDNDIATKTRKEVLFISAASQWNNRLAMSIVSSFKNINIINGLNSDLNRGYTIKMFKEGGERKEQILNFLKSADFCIEDGFVEQMELPDFLKKKMMLDFKAVPKEITTVNFYHNKFNLNNQKIGIEKFNIGEESVGTQKFFDALGPIINTLENGKILFIDEFDNSLHPFLTRLIVDRFEKNNTKNAQLIITSHDTSLLSYKDLNKDQFWFTEKDKFGAGKLFSLAEFDLRNDTEYSKKYLEGRFGALPFIKSV